MYIVLHIIIDLSGPAFFIFLNSLHKYKVYAIINNLLFHFISGIIQDLHQLEYTHTG